MSKCAKTNFGSEATIPRNDYQELEKVFLF